MIRRGLPTLLIALTACGLFHSPPDADVQDAGIDSGIVDAGTPDGGAPVDAGVPDGGTPDGGAIVDAGAPDAGTPDAGTVDAGVPDAGSDAGTPDAGTFDGGTRDAGPLDAGPGQDGGPSDAGSTTTDAGTAAPDAGQTDAGPGTLPDAGTTNPADAGTVASNFSLILDQPLDGAILSADRIGISGHLQGGTSPYQLTLQGTAVSVTGTQFATNLSLAEGTRALELRATDAQGHAAAVTRTIFIDRTPPVITLTDPATNPANVTESPYAISGTVSDAHLSGLTIQGNSVSLIGGAFRYPVALAAGSTDVQLRAVDVAGNATVVTQTLTLKSAPPRVTILSPAAGDVSSPIVTVTAQVTSTAALKEVRIGTGIASDSGSGQYQADVPLSLGTNTLTVSATDVNGLTGTASVTVRYSDALQEELLVTGVDPAPGASGVEPDALVSVSFNKAVANEQLAAHMQVLASGTPLAGGFSLAPGGQTATFIAHSGLPESAHLTVRVSGMPAVTGPAQGADFGSDFTVRAPLTIVRGSVMDSAFHPLANVHVEWLEQNIDVRSGPDGAWVLILPPGRTPATTARLRFTGGIGSDGATYPALTRALSITPQTETRDTPLLLTAVDVGSAEYIDGQSNQTLTFKHRYPGLSVTVAPGAWAFQSGLTTGFVTLTQIAPYALPVPRESQFSGSIWQVGPAGARINGTVSLTLPNRTGAPAGRLALIFAYDPTVGQLVRVGFGRVTSDGTSIQPTAPLQITSLEFFGYMPLSDAQDAAVSATLAPKATDGGLHGQLERRPSRPLWRRILSELTVGEAYAQALLGLFTDAFQQLDTLISTGGVGFIKGTVRAPKPQETQIALLQPSLGNGPLIQTVKLPYSLPVSFSATYVADAAPNSASAPVTGQLSALTPGGSALPPGAGQVWTAQGTGLATVTGSVPLTPGTTQVTLSSQTTFDKRSLVLAAELTPLSDPSQATLKLTQLSDSGAANAEPFHGIIRFSGTQVTVTGPASQSAVTNATGDYGLGVNLPEGDETGISCAQVPFGYVLASRLDAQGNTRQSPINSSFAACSPTYSISSGATSVADVLVDARVLTGTLTFVDRGGNPLAPICDAAAATVRNEDGSLGYISADDVGTTEVYFFREENPTQPLAKYAIATPKISDCSNGAANDHQGSYLRVRVGPSGDAPRAARQRCLDIQAQGPQSDDDRFFLASECTASSPAFLRLDAGDRLSVVAVNHATGYTGLARVTVPAVNQTQYAADGSCPADTQAGGPPTVSEGDQTFPLSRCTTQALGIPADIKLFPPEVDVRIGRAAQDQGASPSQTPHLVRTGGQATTSDLYVQASTHWRVRTVAASDVRPDGGVAQPCDGGNCLSAVSDVGPLGSLLEEFCAELPPTASDFQKAHCLQNDDSLTDVPAGVPPLAGQLVRVTGTAVEQPAVVVFPVQPGRSSATVQVALRIQNSSGTNQALGNLPRANYYLHVVGNSLFPRDTNGDGLLSPDEMRAHPPDFSEPAPSDVPHNPPGLPKGAVGLKNVYRGYDSTNKVEDLFDRAREHELRVIEVGASNGAATVTATRQSGSVPLTGSQPAASEEDVGYQLLLSVLAPDDPSRATAMGAAGQTYTVRLGSDSVGIDCNVNLDSTHHVIRGDCGGESLEDVLSSQDLLYMELFLSGNAENILYRYNFEGISKRFDYLSAGNAYTTQESIKPDPGTDEAPKTRPLSQPALVEFALDTTTFTSGLVQLCSTHSCDSGSLIKSASLTLGTGGKYSITQVAGVEAPLQQVTVTHPGDSAYFSLALPSEYGVMPGSDVFEATPKQVYLVQKPGGTGAPPPVRTLGQPKGEYISAAAHAPGQAQIGGVNLADGRLSFTHEDFAVPQLAEVVRFGRTYNNGNNELGAVGIGWNHAYEGSVLEERPGRYTVVLAGQAYEFTECTHIGADGSASGCQTNNAHGGQLKAVVQSGALMIEYIAQNGMRYRFERLAAKDGSTNNPQKLNGRRRWLLTRFEDGHGDDAGTSGWTVLTYDADYDRLRTVAREGGKLTLSFVYAQPDTTAPGTLPQIKSAVERGFQFLKTVTLTGGSGTLHQVQLTQDVNGNLTSVFRSTGLPTREWRYGYRALQSGEAWALVNEMETATLFLSDAVGSGSFEQWRAIYGRGAASAPYYHLTGNEPEVVTSIVVPGQSGVAYQVTYGGAQGRTVTRPDGVVVQLTLNQYGNINVSALPAASTTTESFGSDAMGGLVTPTQMTEATGRAVGLQTDGRLCPTGTTIAGVAAGAPGKVTTGTLDTRTPNARFCAPDTTDLKSQSAGVVHVDTALDGSGDLTHVMVTDKSGQTDTQWQALSRSPDGVLLSEVDALGRTSVYSDFDGLGLPTKRLLSAAATADGALGTATELRTYDSLGRLVERQTVETGSDEKRTYDNEDRVTKLERDGTPAQIWDYTYTPADSSSLTVTEQLEGTKFVRATTYVDGLKIRETWNYGLNDAKQATRTWSYSGGRLTSSTDEWGAARTYAYDGNGRFTGVTVPTPDGTANEKSYVLDADGKVTQSTDSLGAVTKIGYDNLDRAVAWDFGNGDTAETDLDERGEVVQRKWGSAHALDVVVDGRTRTRTDKSQASSAGGTDQLTEYDLAGRISHTKDNTSGLETFREYKDVLGRLTRQETDMQTQSSGVVTLKRVDVWKYADTPGQTVATVVSTIDTGDADVPTRTQTRRVTMDAMGQTLSTERLVASKSAITNLTLDERGNVVKRVEPAGSGIGTTTFTYDGSGVLLSQTDPVGVVTAYVLDYAARTQTQTGPLVGESRVTTLDTLGRRRSHQIAALGTSAARTWTYRYAPAITTGIQETNARGDVTTRLFNGHGRLTQVLRADASSSNRQVTQDGFDGPNLLTREKTEDAWKADWQWSTDDIGRETERQETGPLASGTYAFDTKTSWTGRVGSRTEKYTAGTRTDTRTSSVTVDSLGNVVTRVAGGITDSWRFDAGGMLSEAVRGGRVDSRFLYDEDLLVHRLDGAGTQVEDTAYTRYLDMRIATETSPAGRTRTRNYDARGLLASETYGMGLDVQRWSYVYDNAGFLKERHEGQGTPDETVWTYAHGPEGETQSAALPGALGTFTYAYDGRGQLTGTTAPTGGFATGEGSGATQSFDWDYLGRPLSKSRGPNHWVTTWTDGEGTTLTPAGDTRKVLMDGRGQVVRETYAQGTHAAASADLLGVQTAYDGRGAMMTQLEHRTASDVTSSYVYDARGRLSSYQRGSSDAVTYAYSTSDVQTQMKVGTQEVDYTVSAPLDRVTKVVGNSGPMSVTWEAGGERILSIASSGLTETRCYDARGRMSQVVNGTGAYACGAASPSGVLAQFAYGYDERGNRLQESYGQPGLPTGETTDYGYDAADRLTGYAIEQSGAATLYQLAQDGTRLGEKRYTSGYTGDVGPGAFASAPATAVNLRYQVNAQGALMGLLDVNTATTYAQFTTDGTGQLTSEVYSGQEKHYGWDAAGRLVEESVRVASPTANRRFRYDGRGLRQETTDVGGGTTRYTWGGQEELLLESLPNVTQPLLYENLNGTVLAAGGERLGHDALGSVVVRQPSVGTAQTNRYTAFGAFRGSSINAGESGTWTTPGPSEATVAFTGQNYDSVSGHYQFQQRWQSPTLGRFLSEDSVGALAYLDSPAELNPFLYARGNPTRWTDPDGRDPSDCRQAGLTGDALNRCFASEAGKVGSVGQLERQSTGPIDEKHFGPSPRERLWPEVDPTAFLNDPWLNLASGGTAALAKKLGDSGEEAAVYGGMSLGQSIVAAPLIAASDVTGARGISEMFNERDMVSQLPLDFDEAMDRGYEGTRNAALFLGTAAMELGSGAPAFSPATRSAAAELRSGLAGARESFGEYLANPANVRGQIDFAPWRNGGSEAATLDASGSLPPLKGLPHEKIRRILEEKGFQQTHVSSSAARNETWQHPDGSEVRIHPYGNQQTGPYKTGNNAHAHKEGSSGGQLDDKGVPSSNPAETHIGISNPRDLPQVRNRLHGQGTQ